MFNETFLEERCKCVLVTELMCKLYEEIHHGYRKEKVESLMIVGPPRIGKTTALLYVYLQFKKINPSHTCYFIASFQEESLQRVAMELREMDLPNTEAVFFCDLGCAMSAGQATLSCLQFIMGKLLIMKKAKVVYSVSSAFLLAMHDTKNWALRSFVTRMYCSSVIIEAKILPEESKYLITKFLPSREHDDIMSLTCGLPGYIYDIWMAKNDIQKGKERIANSRLSAWTEIMSYCDRNSIYKESLVELFVCMCHGISIFPFRELEEVQTLPPVIGHLVQIDENGVPHNILGFKNLSSIITMLDVQYLKTDEGSALGFLYEPIVCQLIIGSTHTQGMEFKKYSVWVREVSGGNRYEAIEEGTTRLQCLPVLRRSQDLTIQGDNQLWLTPRSFKSFDAFAIVGNCMWLVQITTNDRRSAHLEKITNFQNISPEIRECVKRRRIKEVVFAFISSHGVDNELTYAKRFAGISSSINFSPECMIQPKISFALLKDYRLLQYKFLELKCFLSLR